MKRLIGLILAVATLLSAGCASVQKPVPLSLEALAARPTRVGVVLSTLPKPDTRFPGASCLLCLAAASVMNQSLTYHTATLSTDDLATLPQDIAARLRARGIDANAIDERIDLKALPGTRGAVDVAARDFHDVGTRYGFDKLIVLEVAMLGFQRSYSGYVPNSDPMGFLIGAGYMVDLQTNRYEWYTPLRVSKSADGAWDEPPKFPGLTNAYFQVIEMGKDRLIEPFIAP